MPTIRPEAPTGPCMCAEVRRRFASRPTLWKVTIAGGIFSSRYCRTAPRERRRAPDGCSPVTVFKNGSAENLYVSVSSNGAAPGGGGCTAPTTGCVYMYNLTPPVRPGRDMRSKTLPLPAHQRDPAGTGAASSSTTRSTGRRLAGLLFDADEPRECRAAALKPGGPAASSSTIRHRWRLAGLLDAHPECRAGEPGRLELRSHSAMDLPRTRIEERARRGGRAFLRRAAPARHWFQHAAGDPAGRHPADSPLRRRRARRGRRRSLHPPAQAVRAPGGVATAHGLVTQGDGVGACPILRCGATELLGKVIARGAPRAGPSRSRPK